MDVLLLTMEDMDSVDEIDNCDIDDYSTSHIAFESSSGSILSTLLGSNPVQQTPTTKRTRVWVKPRFGRFFEEDLQVNDDDFFKENLRVSRASFDILVEKLQGMKKKDTIFRKAIELEKRIAIALYTLGSSSELRTISNLFGVGKATVTKILEDFCSEVVKKMKNDYLDIYLTPDKFEEPLQGFEAMGLPNCFGAIDGCHVKITPESENATDYYNFKGWYSMVLLAVVDHRCRFTYTNIGAPGRANDSQLYEDSSFKKFVQLNFNNRIKSINGVDVPIYLIGDSAFKLTPNMMKPYAFGTARTEAQALFNYVLSKNRRLVENAFGQIKARFRCMGKGLEISLTHSRDVIETCCILHNFLNEENDNINQHWLEELERTTVLQPPEPRLVLYDRMNEGHSVREALAEYLYTKNSESNDNEQNI